MSFIVLQHRNIEATAFWFVKYSLSVLNHLKVSFIMFGIYKKLYYTLFYKAIELKYYAAVWK